MLPWVEFLSGCWHIPLVHGYPTFPGNIRQNSVIEWHWDHVIFFCDCLLFLLYLDWFCFHLMGKSSVYGEGLEY